MVRAYRSKDYCGVRFDFGANGHRRTALMFPASVDPRANMIVFPGSTQTIDQFLFGLPFGLWNRRGVNVAILGSRASTGHTWLPVTEHSRDKSDPSAVIELAGEALVWWGSLPLWFAGHSGGACFAHTWAVCMMRAEGGPLSSFGIVSNAGWVWPWCEKYIAQHSPTVRVCFRVGERDRLFNRSKRRTAFDGADAYASAGCEVRRVTVPDGRHEWLAADDAALIDWMLGSRQTKPGQ